MLKGKGRFVAAVAALVLAVGASALLPLFEEGRGLPSPSSATSQEGAPSHLHATERAISSPRLTGGASRRERLGRVETPASETPLNLGERLDADGGGADESIGFVSDPVSIGPELDVDDPFANEPGGSTTPPRNLGAPVDANDPGYWPPTEAGHRMIGVQLDADALLGPEADQPVPPTTVEIGELMNAGRPMTR